MAVPVTDASGEGRVTSAARLYREDVDLLARRARFEAARRGRRVPIAELVHEQLAQLRLDERAGLCDGG